MNMTNLQSAAQGFFIPQNSTQTQGLPGIVGGQFAVPPSSELVNASANLQLPQNISRVAAALSRDLAGQIALFTANPGLYGIEYSQSSIIGSAITPGFSLSSWGTPEQGGLASNPTTGNFPGFFQPIPTFPSLRRNAQGFNGLSQGNPSFIGNSGFIGNHGFSGQGSFAGLPIQGGFGFPQGSGFNPYTQTQSGYNVPQGYGQQQSYGGYGQQQGYGMDPYAQQGGYGMPQPQPPSYGGSYSPMPQQYSPY